MRERISVEEKRINVLGGRKDLGLLHPGGFCKKNRVQKSRTEIGVEGMVNQRIELLALRFQFRQIRRILFLQFFVQAVLGLDELGDQRPFFSIEHQPPVLKGTGGKRLRKLGSLLTAEHRGGGSDQLDHSLERDPQAIFRVGCFQERPASE